MQSFVNALIRVIRCIILVQSFSVFFIFFFFIIIFIVVILTVIDLSSRLFRYSQAIFHRFSMKLSSRLKTQNNSTLSIWHLINSQLLFFLWRRRSCSDDMIRVILFFVILRTIVHHEFLRRKLHSWSSYFFERRLRLVRAECLRFSTLFHLSHLSIILQRSYKSTNVQDQQTCCFVMLISILTLKILHQLKA